MSHPGIDLYVAKLEPWMQERFETIRQLILTFPEIKETFRYQAPFYDYHGMMLYMGHYRRTRFVMGFCNGVLMKNEAGILRADANQTQIRHLEFFKDRPMNEALVIACIHEAMQVNEQLKEQVHANKNKTGKRR